jgi:type IV secretion system protein VirB9
MRLAAATTLMLALQAAFAAGEGPIRVIAYDPGKVIHVPVARGVPTHVQFEEGETIDSAPAAGLASVCRTSRDSSAQAEVAPDAWDLCAARGGRNLFIKPVGTSRLPNPVAVVTNRRSYSFSFNVVGNPVQAVQRLSIQPPKPPEPDPVTVAAQQKLAMALAAAPKEEDVIQARMALPPLVRNAQYTVALGRDSEDVRPVAVFDDGQATYFHFPHNRPKPAVFKVNADGSEEQVNPRFDLATEMLAVDQVARGWRLRLGANEGSPVASVRNEAYDPQGVAPVAGSAVEGVRRVVRNPRTGNFEER